MAQFGDLAKTLEQIGLTEKEARVYLTLLSLESSTAYQIAQHCEIKKPTVYVILEDLREKGLVLKIPHAKKALFAARDISEYLAEQEKRLSAARSIVPTLHALGSESKPNVYFFSGTRGFEQALGYKFDSMRGKTFHCFYGNLAGVPRDIVERYAAWDRKALGAGISFDLIMAREGSGKYYKDIIDLAKKSENVDIRYLENFPYPPNASIDIAPDFVRIFNEKIPHITIIDDKSTADAMLQIFKVMWEKGV